MSDIAEQRARTEAHPIPISISEERVPLSVETFSWFYNYQPSHIEAFIASFFCLVFAIGITVAGYIESYEITLLDIPVYFLVMSFAFFLMAKNLMRYGQR